jgi:hypothetical protein
MVKVASDQVTTISFEHTAVCGSLGKLVSLHFWMARTITFHQIKELSLQYDGDGATVKGCEIHQSSAATTCTVSFTADSDMNAPVYVYYQLSNFYQVPVNNKES